MLTLHEKCPQNEQRHKKVMLLHDNIKLHSPKYFAVRLFFVPFDGIYLAGCSIHIQISNNSLVSFIDNLKNDTSIYQGGIWTLPQRWEKLWLVIENTFMIHLWDFFLIKMHIH